MKLSAILYIFLLFGEGLCQRSLSSESCLKAKPKILLGRIVGGQLTEPGEIPYIVSLTRRGGHFCGASILNERWLITAGHCVCSGAQKYLKPTQIQATFGLHRISDLNKLDNDGPFVIELKSIVIHPGYECSKPDNDIALLELKDSITFGDRVKPICIADDDTIPIDRSVATVSGWGWTSEDRILGDRSDILKKVSLDVWNNKECQSSYAANNKKNIIRDTQLCAGKKNGGEDSCWTDSGGPLVSNDNVLIGIVSTGIGCARPGLPGIYTRLTRYVDWIESMVRAG